MKNTRIFCIVLCFCMVVHLIACTSGGDEEVIPCADNIWGTALLIETDSNSAGSSQVGFDGSGNAIAVWFQSDGPRMNIWANRYVAGTGWVLPQLIETDSDSGYWPQVGVDESGNAVAVWQQYDGTRWNIWANTLR